MQADVSRRDRVAALGEDIDQEDWDDFVEKGTMQELEKSYFYALDQFKGMRQDCTVQHLRNDLTVRHCPGLTS